MEFANIVVKQRMLMVYVCGIFSVNMEGVSMIEIIEGQKYNHITVIRKAHRNKNSEQMYLCRCDCGKEYFLRAGRIGKNISCGCMNHRFSGGVIKHGGANTRLYRVWVGIKRRCNKTNDARYADYGGRGISICPEWMDYNNFREWAYANGYDPNAAFMKCTLDRIDNDGNYEPSNCRWVDMKKQGNNKRTNRYLTYKGEIHTLSEWSSILGIEDETLRTRLERGWSIKEAIETPVSHKRIHKNYYREQREKICQDRDRS